MTVIHVAATEPYDVTIGHHLTDDIVQTLTAYANVAIITQPTVTAKAKDLKTKLDAAGVNTSVISIPDAEAGKTLTVAGHCWDECGSLGLGRKDAIVGLGGGAATDLAGFIAATWMRGIDVVQIPTTVLAMVDAAVGGKTGINTAAGKNLVGSFHSPRAVFVDLETIRTLPEEEIVAGSAEIVKCGFIADPEILALYEKDPIAALSVDGSLPELVERAIAVKANVVAQDFKEAGLREILNYGHTFGHAIERHEDYLWRHGCAVAVGMCFVAELSAARGLIDDELRQRHYRVLQSIGLPTTYPLGHFDDLLTGMRQDKKNRAGTLRFVAIEAVGKTTRLEGPDNDELKAAYEALAKAGK